MKKVGTFTTKKRGGGGAGEKTWKFLGKTEQEKRKKM